MRADDLRDLAQVRVRRIAGERRHHTEDLSRAEWDLDPGADFDPSFKLRRDDVIEFATQRDFKGDTGDLQPAHSQKRREKCKVRKAKCGTLFIDWAKLKAPETGAFGVVKLLHANAIRP